MLEIRKRFLNAGRVVGWVAGLGGAGRGVGVSRSVEHIELVENLRLAGVKDIKVYASDFNRKVIRKAKRDLKMGEVRIPTDMSPPEYSASILGELPANRVFKLPEQTRKSIVLLGGENQLETYS